ncbi:iron-containing alcohol dehydrogenase [Streptosporangium sp. NPDC023615]|uniref:iron-containing alcohol dehydrogenase n=1 Tax=Streptosporangium sp. NPDC023615 TaxID=3154794 RepID=UPI0034191556
MSVAHVQVDTLLMKSPRTLIGAGRAASVAKEAETVSRGTSRPVRVLLVVGAGFPRRPWHTAVVDALRPVRLHVAVQPSMPTPASVARLAGEARAHRADVVVAVGGGSVLDGAKAAAALSYEPADPTCESVVDACDGTAPAAGLPVVAVPTTPGTGAEATPFATIWDVDRGRKLSLRGDSVLPAVAILDPDLLLGLPGTRLACSLLDTFAQALEGAWSTRADERAEALGAAAWARLSGFLDRPDRSPRAPEAWERQDALLAGHYAGRAIAVAGTTVCHALSYPLTLRYGLDHGQACGVTLGRVLRYNAAVEDADCADARGAGRVRAAIARVVAAAGADDASTLARRIESFLASSGLPPVPDLRPDAARIAAEALGYDRAGNNPRRLSIEDLTLLLTTAP